MVLSISDRLSKDSSASIVLAGVKKVFVFDTKSARESAEISNPSQYKIADSELDNLSNCSSNKSSKSPKIMVSCFKKVATRPPNNS